MASVNTSLLVLLDPADKYQYFEENYDAQLFSRFTNQDRCVLHILSRLANVRLLHFFLPQATNNLIHARVTLFRNTIFYIYCKDQAGIDDMEQTHNYPVFVKVFHVDSLPTQLHQAAVTHLIERAHRARHDPDEFDTAAQEAIHHLNALIQDLEVHMTTKTGRQPED